MIVLGLTGSIGMGKTTTALLFAKAGIPVFDADAAVHRLYAGEAVRLIEQAFPGTVRSGSVDRALLSKMVIGKPSAMRQLERIIHPLVARAERAFVHQASQVGHQIALLDIPLLMESGRLDRAHAIVVVSAPADIQRTRVLRRDGMSEEKFQAILAKQLPDRDKRRRAHFIIDTGRGLSAADQQVGGIIRACRAMVGTVRHCAFPDGRRALQNGRLAVNFP
jgi:dephospho-CoA kinase